MTKLTRKLIQDSFVKLLSEKSFDKISVRDIVEECGINRNTFYYHYNDISDLINDILQLRFDGIVADIDEIEAYENQCIYVVNWFKEHKKNILNVYNSSDKRSIDAYVYKISEILGKNFIKSNFSNNLNQLQNIVLNDYYCALIYGYLMMIMDHEIPDDIDKKVIETFKLTKCAVHAMRKELEKDTV